MLNNEIKNFIKNAIIEDLGDGDHSSIGCIPKKKFRKAKLVIKQDGIIAGIELAKLIFKEIDHKINITKSKNDGDKVKNGDIGFIVEGNCISILQAERIVLNCMQRMSAIATKTNYIKSLISDTKCKLLDTRKTTPLNRFIEKWAVKIGGGNNHRFGLYDMIMIKDNHIDFAGGISKAVNKIKKYLNEKNKDLDIIIEARNIDEVKEILLESGIKRIILDNFDYKTTRRAVNIIDNKYEIESSGGITEKTIKKYAQCGVNYISVGSLTNSVSSFDLSLKAM